MPDAPVMLALLDRVATAYGQGLRLVGVGLLPIY